MAWPLIYDSEYCCVTFLYKIFKGFPKHLQQGLIFNICDEDYNDVGGIILIRYNVVLYVL